MSVTPIMNLTTMLIPMSWYILNSIVLQWRFMSILNWTQWMNIWIQIVTKWSLIFKIIRLHRRRSGAVPATVATVRYRSFHGKQRTATAQWHENNFSIESKLLSPRCDSLREPRRTHSVQKLMGTAHPLVLLWRCRWTVARFGWAFSCLNCFGCDSTIDHIQQLWISRPWIIPTLTLAMPTSILEEHLVTTMHLMHTSLTSLMIP